MSLRLPVPGAITLHFAQVYAAERRTLFHQEYRGLPLACYPSRFPGCDANPTVNYHDGTDWGAPEGTPILAAERCRIEQFGTDSVSRALYVYARIRPQTRIEMWHLRSFRAGLYRGQIIPKGGVIGYVGHTGWSTGPHLHFGLAINERDPDGVTRFYHYNPELFFAGALLAADPRVAPYY